MSFLYINPGYSELTDTASLDKSYTTTNSTYNPYNSVSFVTGATNCNLQISLNNEKEYWLKYGIYRQQHTTTSTNISIIDTSANKLIIDDSNIILNSTTLSTYSYAESSYIEFEIHIKSDATNGIIEFWENNNTLLYSYSGNVFSGNNISSVLFPTSTLNKYYISNIIINDTGRIGAEKIGILSYKSIDTDMTKDSNNNYESNVAGSHYYITPDKTAFISNKNLHANEVEITGVNIASTMASFDSGTLALSDTYIKNNSTSIETLIGEKSCNISTNYVGIHNETSINPETSKSWTLTDLDNYQFGVKTKNSTT